MGVSARIPPIPESRGRLPSVRGSRLRGNDGLSPNLKCDSPVNKSLPDPSRRGKVGMGVIACPGVHSHLKVLEPLTLRVSDSDSHLYRSHFCSQLRYCQASAALHPASGGPGITLRRYSTPGWRRPACPARLQAGWESVGSSCALRSWLPAASGRRDGGAVPFLRGRRLRRRPLPPGPG